MIERSWCQIAPNDQMLCDYATGNQWLDLHFQGAAEGHGPTTHAVAAIEATMRNLSLTDAQHDALERIQAGTRVVIGGQQVGHLGGPLYTWLKIASIIVHARRSNAVPVFWIEDNDHDMLEAQRISVITRTDELVTLDCPAAQRYSAHTIVGACAIGSSIVEQLDQLQEHFEGLPFTSAVLEILRHCYNVGRLWSEAFMEWHQQFWGKYGLLFVRSSVLREQGAMQPLVLRELEHIGELAQVVHEQTAELVARGYQPQLEIATINAFYHQGQRRYRITVEPDGRLRAGRQQWSADELCALAQQHPELFSPSAALRPLVQDALFAPHSTVVGPAELKYHAQLRRAYHHWQIPKPHVVLRHSATLVPERVMRTLNRYREQQEVFFAPQEHFDRWLTKLLDQSGLLVQLASARDSIGKVVAELEHAADRDDPTLGRAVAATSHRIATQLERLERTFRHAIRKRNEQQRWQVHAARTHLFPSQRLQERVIVPIHWVCSVGIAQWSTVLLAIAEQSNRLHYIATPNELLMRVVGTQVAQ
jgi:bacillithiol biosynthesis cysteine-adding enzyme BshC